MAKDAPRKAARKKSSRKPARPATTEGRPASFTPDVLESTIIALPLLDRLEKDGLAAPQDIIVDVNRDYPGGRDKAQERIKELIAQLIKAHRVRGQGVHVRKTELTRQYVFGRLRGDLIQELVKRDRELAAKEDRKPALYRVWPDFEVQVLTDRSIAHRQGRRRPQRVRRVRRRHRVGGDRFRHRRQPSAFSGACQPRARCAAAATATSRDLRRGRRGHIGARGADRPERATARMSPASSPAR